MSDKEFFSDELKEAKDLRMKILKISKWSAKVDRLTSRYSLWTWTRDFDEHLQELQRDADKLRDKINENDNAIILNGKYS